MINIDIQLYSEVIHTLNANRLGHSPMRPISWSCVIKFHCSGTHVKSTEINQGYVILLFMMDLDATIRYERRQRVEEKWEYGKLYHRSLIMYANFFLQSIQIRKLRMDLFANRPLILSAHHHLLRSRRRRHSFFSLLICKQRTHNRYSIADEQQQKKRKKWLNKLQVISWCGRLRMVI